MISQGLAARHIQQELKNVLRDPEWMVVLADIMGKLQDGLFDPAYQNAVFQKWEGRSGIDIEDVYCFGLINAMIQTKKISFTRLHVGVEPFADSEVKRNDHALRANLKRLTLSGCRDESPACEWSGSFYGGKQGEDGVIRWDGSATFEVNDDGQSAGYVQFPSGNVPLEVGVTTAAKTYLQIMNGGVARWPYDEEWITVFKLTRAMEISYVC